MTAGGPGYSLTIRRMSEPPTAAILHAQDVHFAYGTRPALCDVSLSLRPGQVVALIGPNGSGKSTLIKVLLGQLKAAHGQIGWCGRPLQQWRGRDLAKLVAYLPQSPTADGDQRVSDVLRLGRTPYLRAFGVESPRDIEVVTQVSRLLGLDELLDRRIDELSGGQRQTVFVGRCLVQEPQALLLDEPNTYLDLRHQIQLSQLLRRLAQQHALGVLLASHDLNLAGAFADRLVLLDGGRIAAAGTPHEVLEPQRLSTVYGVHIQRLERPDGAPMVFPIAGE